MKSILIFVLAFTALSACGGLTGKQIGEVVDIGLDMTREIVCRQPTEIREQAVKELVAKGTFSSPSICDSKLKAEKARPINKREIINHPLDSRDEEALPPSNNELKKGK